MTLTKMPMILMKGRKNSTKVVTKRLMLITIIIFHRISKIS